MTESSKTIRADVWFAKPPHGFQKQQGITVMKRFLGLLGFSILLSLYLTVIFILGRVATFLFFFTLLAWMIIRQPISHPDRVDTDIKEFAERVAKTVQWLAELLTYPLINIK